MKQNILRFILFLITIGVVVGMTSSRTAPTATDIDASEIVDIMVDAGIEFSGSRSDIDLLKYRKIVITTDINAITAQRVIKGLILLDAIDDTPIDLYIRTEGGWISDAFAIIDIMESINAPVNTHSIGGSYSSGAMILAAGTGIRFGLPNSSIMFHGGRYEDDSEFSDDKLDNDRLSRFWETHSQIPKEWLSGYKDKKYFLTSEDALKYGIIPFMVWFYYIHRLGSVC